VATEHLEAPEPVEFGGAWGLFRVLDLATRDASRVGEVRFNWVLRRPGRYGVHVPFVVEPARRENPFEENLLYGLTCPDAVGG
jgi:type VI protein secretion system component VasK